MSRPEEYGTNNCRVTTVAGLPPRFLRSCWSPSGLVRFANIWSRPRFGRTGCTYRDIAWSDEEKLNRITEIRETGCEWRDMVIPSLQPDLAFEPTGTCRLCPSQVRW